MDSDYFETRFRSIKAAYESNGNIRLTKKDKDFIRQVRFKAHHDEYPPHKITRLESIGVSFEHQEDPFHKRVEEVKANAAAKAANLPHKPSVQLTTFARNVRYRVRIGTYPPPRRLILEDAGFDFEPVKKKPKREDADPLWNHVIESLDLQSDGEALKWMANIVSNYSRNFLTHRSRPQLLARSSTILPE